MYSGHVGAALAIGRAETDLNVGVLVVAALLPDFLLWIFVLCGWEYLVSPANFVRTHQVEYEFPYSHGLVSSFGWSALAGVATLLWYPGARQAKARASGLVALAVFLHWLLDALVRVPELPIAGVSSPRVGLGLWQAMPWALALEAAITLAGLYFFISGSGLSSARKVGLAVLSTAVLVFTVVGMTVAPAPPSAIAVAASSLITLTLVCALACWLGRFPAKPSA
jgi:hypothetical protein